MTKQFKTDEFEAIFHRYKDMVLKTAYFMLGDIQEAEDVLQEVFINAYRSWDSFDPQKGKFNTWLHRITVNQCISEHRGKQASLVSLERDGEDGLELPDNCSESPEDILINQEERARIKQAMESLHGKYCMVLTMRYFNDLSYDEIAQALKIPLGTVGSRIYAALRALKKELRIEEADSEL